MKRLIPLAILFLGLNLSAQNSLKKQIFLDENNKSINETELNSRVLPPDYIFVYSTIETDTTVIKKLVRRKEFGMISESGRLKVISVLTDITGEQIDPDQTVIINFFHEGLDNGSKTRTIKHYSSDKKYKKFIDKNPHIAQFFISENTFNYRSKNVYVDSTEQIENMLFYYPFNSNYIIIRPNGHYFKHVSEYRQLDIPAIVEADWGINEAKSNLITK